VFSASLVACVVVRYHHIQPSMTSVSRDSLSASECSQQFSNLRGPHNAATHQYLNAVKQSAAELLRFIYVQFGRRPPWMFRNSWPPIALAFQMATNRRMRRCVINNLTHSPGHGLLSPKSGYKIGRIPHSPPLPSLPLPLEVGPLNPGRESRGAL